MLLMEGEVGGDMRRQAAEGAKQGKSGSRKEAGRVGGQVPEDAGNAGRNKWQGVHEWRGKMVGKRSGLGYQAGGSGTQGAGGRGEMGAGRQLRLQVLQSSKALGARQLGGKQSARGKGQAT